MTHMAFQWLVTTVTDDPQDVEDASQLINESERHYGLPQTPGARARELVLSNLSGQRPTAWLILARSESGIPAGYAISSLLWPSVGLAPALFLKELFVGARFRRRGVGRLLLEETRKLAQTHGCNRLDWTADCDAESAIRFYGQLGVKPLPTKLLYRLDNEALQRPLQL